MKKIIFCLLMICCCLSLAACKNEGTNIPSDIKEEKDQEIINDETALINYENEELGISFKYPPEWGEVVENRYKEDTLLTLKFEKDGEIKKDIGFGSSGDLDEDMNFRSCDDILENGYNSGDRMPSSCETINVDGQDITVSYFKQDKYSSSDLNQAQIMTKKGVWFISNNDRDLDADFMNLLNSMRFSK